MIGIQGTSNFNDYSVFISAMGVALRRMPENDTELTVFSAGPLNVNRFSQEFLNVSERSFKARNIRVKLVKVPPSWFEKNMTVIDYFAFLSKPKEPVSKLIDLADAKDVAAGIFRF
jgi:hypothetical protein